MASTADWAPSCPYCHTEDTTSVPIAGPAAPFYCPHCDLGFSTGDL